MEETLWSKIKNTFVPRVVETEPVPMPYDAETMEGEEWYSELHRENWGKAIQCIKYEKASQLNQLLRDDPIILEMYDSDSKNILHHALDGGHSPFDYQRPSEKCAHVILDHCGHSLNGIGDKYFRTPLTTALNEDLSADLVRRLCVGLGQKSLFVAVHDGYESYQDEKGKKLAEVFKAGLDPNFDPSALLSPSGEKRSALIFHAASNCDHGLMKGLLEQGANPNATDSIGASPIHYVMNVSGATDRKPVIELLIKHGADQEALFNGHSPKQIAEYSDLRQAVWNEMVDDVKRAIDMGHADYALCKTSFALAKQAGWGVYRTDALLSSFSNDGGSEITEQLLFKAGWYTKYQGGDGDDTALNAAIRRGEFDIAKKIIRAGADVNEEFNNGDTVISNLARDFTDEHLSPTKKAEMMSHLIEMGGDVHHTDDYQQTALHHAVHSEVAEALLINGADPEARDKLGRTPLEVIRYKVKRRVETDIEKYKESVERLTHTANMLERHQERQAERIMKELAEMPKVETHQPRMRRKM